MHCRRGNETRCKRWEREIASHAQLSTKSGSKESCLSESNYLSCGNLSSTSPTVATMKTKLVVNPKKTIAQPSIFRRVAILSKHKKRNFFFSSQKKFLIVPPKKIILKSRREKEQILWGWKPKKGTVYMHPPARCVPWNHIVQPGSRSIRPLAETVLPVVAVIPACIKASRQS